MKVAIASLLFMAIALIGVVMAGEEKSPNPRGLEQTPITFTGRRRVRKEGAACQYSSDCASGCCRKVALSTGGSRRRCSPKAKLGERCSDGQVKLDVYLDHCPCEADPGHCKRPDYICNASP